MMSEAEFFAGITGRSDDVTRLVESHPRILSLVPAGLVPEIDQLRAPS